MTHRQPPPAPTAGKPLTLREHFFWTVIIVFACAVLVAVFAAIPWSDIPPAQCETLSCTSPADTPADP